jgi:hypothetical protein
MINFKTETKLVFDSVTKMIIKILFEYIMGFDIRYEF